MRKHLFRLPILVLILALSTVIFGQTQHGIVLNWTASLTTGVTGYNIYRATLSGGPYTKLNTALVTGTTFEDTIGTGGTKYYYVVTSVEPDGAVLIESVFSNETSNIFPLVPAAPVGLQSTPQ